MTRLTLFSLFTCFSMFIQAQEEVIRVVAQRNALGMQGLLGSDNHYQDLTVTTSGKPTLADWLADAPEIQLNGQGGQLQSYSVRGFSRWRVRTEVAGIPILTDRRAGNSASFIVPELLGGIGLRTGPSSALYGSQAMGGVVALQPVQFGENWWQGRAQNNNNLVSFATAKGGEHWQTALGITKAQNGKAANGEPLFNQYQRMAGLLAGKMSISDYKVSWLIMPSVGKELGKSSRFYPDSRRSHYPNDNHLLGKFSIRQGNDWLASVYQHYQNWDSDTLRIGRRRNLTEYQAHTVGTEWIRQLNYLGGKGRVALDWQARKGVSIDESEFNASGDLLSARRPLLNGQQDNLGLLVDQHWQQQKWQWSLAAHYDRIWQQAQQARHSTQASHLSLSGQLRWHYQANGHLTLEAGNAFRFPELTERYFFGETPRGTTQGNPHLQKEQSKGGQLGWQTTLFKQHTFSLTSYYYRLNNYIERYRLTPDLRSYRNLPTATLYGWSAQLTLHTTKHWQHKIILNWQRGHDKTRKPLADLQQPGLQWQASWQYAHFTLNSHLRFHARQNRVSESEAPRAGYTLWSISGQWQATPDISISLYANNLLNKRVVTSADEDAPYIPGRVIGVKWQYQL